ncbi:hypothetical protein EJ08DRAFT_209864 [Tothia fuscella]|uniref:Uncharacterized protein n=1 Tax=Tothia fuscella TaxID=1048955 RepID=A0A9P4NSB8_9PEZI|nr:hypothetical protein EJ08DRAFT_209864 [Tothia fuscella]
MFQAPCECLQKKNQHVETKALAYSNFVSKLGGIAMIDYTLEPYELVNELVAEGPYDLVVDTIFLPNTVTVTARVLAALGGGILHTT